MFAVVMGTAADTDHCANLLFVGTCTAGEINKIWSIRPLLFFGKMLKVTFWVNSKPFLQLGAWYTGLVADIYMGTRFFQIRKQQVSCTLIRCQRSPSSKPSLTSFRWYSM